MQANIRILNAANIAEKIWQLQDAVIGHVESYHIEASEKTSGGTLQTLVPSFIVHKIYCKIFPEDCAIIWQMTGNTSLRWDKVEQSVSDSTKPRKWRHFRFVREEWPLTAMTASFACSFELASSYFAEATNSLSKRGPFLQPWKTGNLRTPALNLKKIEDKRETPRL